LDVPPPADGGASIGTWTPLPSNPVDNSAASIILLTDGSVLVGGGNDYHKWTRLKPDSFGSYANGTWTPAASSFRGRLYYPEFVLGDGRVWLAGGEYIQATDQNNNATEIYDPVTDQWAQGPDGLFGDIADAPGAMMADGRIIVGHRFSNKTQIFDATTNTYSAAANLLDTSGSEAGWQILPDGSIFDTIRVGERYLPSTNEWIATAAAPITMSTTDEQGPLVLLPDGRVYCASDLSASAYFTPPATERGLGSWTIGPTLPSSQQGGDTPAAVEPNGKILLEGTTGQFGPFSIYELDPSTDTLTPVPSPISLSAVGYATRMLLLPNGQVMFSTGSSFFVYTPLGGPLDAWRPTVSSVAANDDGSYTLTGTQLNGRTIGASYGDDAMMSSNFPVVYLKDGSGHVFYARSYNFSTMGVATGDTSVSCQFRLPSGLAAGSYDLFVSASGVSSGTAFPFSVGSCTAETDAAFCIRLHKECGTVTAADNCGTTRTVASCGTCVAPSTCGGGGVANVCGTSCTPQTDAELCASSGKNCGSITAVDNCGATRTVASCGTCVAPNTCGGAGTANVCGCTGETDAQLCSAHNAQCRSISVTDGCGSARTVASCGTCAAPNTCGGAGTANVCGCTPETDAELCAARSAQCGSISATDRCGGARTVASCGSCTSPDTCGGGGTANICGNTGPVDRTEGGTASASTTASCNPATEDLTKAYDNKMTSTDFSKWCVTAAPSTGTPISTMYDFAGSTAFVITSYTITSGNDVPARDPKNWTFQGCLGTCSAGSGTGWVTLDTRTNQTFANRFQTNTYTIANTTAYQQYRLRVTANNGATNRFQIAELQMFGNPGSCTGETDAAFCSRLGKNCGQVSGTDNCGAARTVASCGSCTAPQTCGGGGTDNVCGASCTPETDAAFCSRLGKNCGQVNGTDNCGAARTVASCGSCTAPQTCGGGGTANVCGDNGTPLCSPAYAQSDCLTYTSGTKVSSGGHNWTCSNGNCANCATFTSCAPGGTGCPWGVVWTDNGACH
jgi:hypothetical protein